MWLKLLAANYRMIGLGEPLVCYRKHARNTSRNLESLFENMMLTYSAYQHHPAYERVVNHYMQLMFVAAAKGDSAFAWKLLRRMNIRCVSRKVLYGLWLLLRRAL